MSLVRLYKLQQVDTALARAIAHRQKLDDGAAQRVAVDSATGRLAELNDQIHADQAKLKDLDLEIRSLDGKRAQVEADMYSGRVRNPKELSAMQNDVAALARTKSALEDEVLALYERGERLDADVAGSTRDLEALRTDADRQASAYREAVAIGDREIASLEAQRAELVSAIDEDVLRRYDRLRPVKGGLAVVVVRSDGICDGCHVAVPERVVSRLRRDPDGVQTCDACGRILVVLSPN